ncbi:sugar ABC transporter substrate-binding protein [Bacillus sp. FJAT-49732]|uniref:Sugar ABC transporter substrate-binding protein n=1 Tax=Lederbergia citrisecunda TaxID=2833583 RepID=A0A942YNR9_9BACI|nr:sugar ABC transporter substrate-binding protein [Lederbergia citrisecunda]MBS4200586.1 sugar ABC transporter substrate-binding protein [Lederbergia citrisecunda]
MLKKFKGLSILLFIALLIIPLTGCKSEKSGSNSNGEKVEVSFMGWGNEQERKLYAEMFKKFEEKHPNIKVNYIYVPQDYDTKLKTMIKGNTVPDVFYVGENLVTEYVKTGKLAELDQYIEMYPELVANFVPGLLEYGKVDGKQYSIPKDWEPYIMYINKDLFNEAGVPIPTGDWDMEEYIDIANKLTKKEDGKTTQYGAALDTWWGPWSVFTQNEGGVWFKDGKSNFNTPEVIKGLTRMYDLFQTFKAAPSPATLKQSGMGQSQMFETGKVAMYPTGQWMVPTYREALNFEWTAVEMPKGATRVNPIFSGTLAVSADSKHQDEAVELLKYTLSKEGLQEIIGLGLGMPTNTEFFDDPSMVTSPPDADVLKATSNYLDTQVQLEAARSGHFSEFMDKYVTPQLDAAFNGKQTIEEAVKLIDEKANSELFK